MTHSALILDAYTIDSADACLKTGVLKQPLPRSQKPFAQNTMFKWQCPGSTNCFSCKSGWKDACCSCLWAMCLVSSLCKYTAYCRTSKILTELRPLLTSAFCLAAFMTALYCASCSSSVSKLLLYRCCAVAAKATLGQELMVVLIKQLL